MEKSDCKRIIRWLPTEVIQVIFSKLPFVNLPLCRVVCRIWNDLVLNHTSTCKFTPDSLFLCTSEEKMNCIDFEFDPKDLDLARIRFVASIPFEQGYHTYSIVKSCCNGLLLVFRVGHTAPRCPCILNPLTNDYIKLPPHQFYGIRDGKFYHYGFGFSPNTKRYKIVRVFNDLKQRSSFYDILTLGGSGSGTNQWRFVCSTSSFYKQGIYFDGALYWIGRCVDKQHVICRLDIEKEKFAMTSFPSVASTLSASLQPFNGTVYTFVFTKQPYTIEVWRMMPKDSWIKEFVIDNSSRIWSTGMIIQINFIKAYENGGILCQINSSHLALYNTKSGRMKPIQEFHQIVCLDSPSFDSLQNIKLEMGCF